MQALIGKRVCKICTRLLSPLSEGFFMWAHIALVASILATPFTNMAMANDEVEQIAENSVQSLIDGCRQQVELSVIHSMTIEEFTNLSKYQYAAMRECQALVAATVMTLSILDDNAALGKKFCVENIGSINESMLSVIEDYESRKQSADNMTIPFLFPILSLLETAECTAD